jgi:hypothetical protein
LDVLTPYTHHSELQAIQTLGFSAFTRRILATDCIVSLSLKITHKVFSSQPNSFLAIILQLPIPKTRLDSIPLRPYTGRLASRNSTQFLSTKLFFIITLRRLSRKHSLFIAGTACLQRCSITTEVTRLLLAYSLRGNMFTESLPNNERLF